MLPVQVAQFKVSQGITSSDRPLQQLSNLCTNFSSGVFVGDQNFIDGDTTAVGNTVLGGKDNGVTAGLSK